MRFKKNIPNIITSFRILGTLWIIFLTPLKAPFFIAYTLTGVTDALDGLTARLTHTTSDFGSKLDSVADLLFYLVSLIKLLPLLWELLPRYIWIFVALILLLRVVSYTVSAVKFHCFASRHTVLNKITGALVFAIPYLLLTPAAVIYCFAVCVVGFLATAEELWIHSPGEGTAGLQDFFSSDAECAVRQKGGNAGQFDIFSKNS